MKIVQSPKKIYKNFIHALQKILDNEIKILSMPIKKIQENKVELLLTKDGKERRKISM